MPDLGSITAASEDLHLTQPTVSMQLKKLSEAIGMPLYEWVGRGREFTDAGRALAATAREVLDSFERLDVTLSTCAACVPAHCAASYPSPVVDC